MQPRTIVSIEQDTEGALVARLLKAESNLPNARQSIPIGFDAGAIPAMDDEAKVQLYGALLRDALKKHPAIQSALSAMFQLPDGQSRALCFEIVALQGEQIRWEALCDDAGDFVALGGRCRVSRIADEVSRQDAGIRPFNLPLRICAFMSAAGRDATPEWTAFVSAFDGARSAGLALEARVFVGQQQLLDRIRQELADGQHPGVTIASMPSSDLDVEGALNEYRPQLVHFFCHGSSGFGKAYLELATIVDHDTESVEGSVVVEVNSLVEAGGVRNAWLVVLNCCEGAAAGERLASMAFRIVANGSVPAVIGMQEPIPAGDANVFCEKLYPELFRLLSATATESLSKPVALDLTETLVPARRAIRNRHRKNPSSFHNWTLPVLYVQKEPLQVQCRPAESDEHLALMRDRVRLVAGLLRQLPPDADPALRAQFLGVLDKPPVVPPELRPDSMGQIPIGL
ncbi:MAG: hypothetical protein MNPFHGCM_00267 [Gemmatimonadaceae bacterium]|nr:hypothetical protein [Gemmatimonadaceae bacterium]